MDLHFLDEFSTCDDGVELHRHGYSDYHDYGYHDDHYLRDEVERAPQSARARRPSGHRLTTG